jgi:hypothetical protein
VIHGLDVAACSKCDGVSRLDLASLDGVLRLTHLVGVESTSKVFSASSKICSEGLVTLNLQVFWMAQTRYEEPRHDFCKLAKRRWIHECRSVLEIV